MGRFKKIGVIYNYRLEAARLLSEGLARKYGADDAVWWVCPTIQEEKARELAQGTDLILSVGGDGTILRTARVTVPLSIPILGINLGKLGFMTELKGSEALEKVGTYLTGDVWIDQRAMLDVSLAGGPGREGPLGQGPLQALNDAVVSRGAIARVIYVEALIDGVDLGTYKVDALIVATATGSTGYAMAAGGPILYPHGQEMVIMPVSPHLCLNSALVVSQDSEIELRARGDPLPMLSIDGQTDVPLGLGDVVKVKRSTRAVRFLRAREPSHFYSTLLERLSIHPAPTDPLLGYHYHDN